MKRRDAFPKCPHSRGRHPGPALGCVSGGCWLGIGSPRASDGSVTPGVLGPSMAGKHRSIPGAPSITVFFKNLIFLV